MGVTSTVRAEGCIHVCTACPAAAGQEGARAASRGLTSSCRPTRSRTRDLSAPSSHGGILPFSGSLGLGPSRA